VLIAARLRHVWACFWMRWASLSPIGRVATRLATLAAPPHRARRYLAGLNVRGYVSPLATIFHADCTLGRNVFIGDRVVVYRAERGGSVNIGDRVRIYGDSCLETGDGGTLSVGAETSIHLRCQLMAYKSSIVIGRGVALAANCSLYPYDHGVAPGTPIREQALESRGPIIIDDEAWLGANVTVLSGVRIGKGAVIGAGSVVTRDVPDGCVAVGVPARVVRNRHDIAQTRLGRVAG
jgi:acetyltransferase-like isoleucine patch superfamily enzyme